MAAAMEVREIQPVIFRRSDIPYDIDRLMNRVDRWRKLCVGDVSASGGGYLPDILDPVTLSTFLESKKHGVIFDEEAPSENNNKINSIKFQKGKKYCALVGPEGGIEREEVELAKQKGLDVASLGPWILKAELAGVLAPMWVYERVG
jgi:16S rRNA (uracil1498-N3)-methyltransferase